MMQKHKHVGVKDLNRKQLDELKEVFICDAFGNKELEASNEAFALASSISDRIIYEYFSDDEFYGNIGYFSEENEIPE